MGFQKGNKLAGKRKGIPNRATANAREAIRLFVEDNAPRLQGWLDQIASEEGPLTAFQCVERLLEYHLPKQARIENVGEGGGPLKVAAELTFVRSPENKS